MPRFTRNSLLLGACLTALAAAPVQAQDDVENDPTTNSTVDRIVVTGTSIRGIDPTGSNVISVDRADMEATGVTSTSDLLAQIPQTTKFNTLSAGSSSFGAVTDVPNLRGIGLGGTATLVLLNGRRMIGAGILQTIPEPSVIPPLALQRVEIIPDGASAIYGSDAVAGVINLITRDGFEGAETSLRFGAADSYTEWNFGQVFGVNWSEGSALIAYDFNHHDNLSGADRDFITTDRSLIGGTDERSTSCAAANIAVGGIEVFPGFFFGETIFAAPGLQPNTQNRCDTSDWTDVYGEENRHSLYGSLNQRLSPRLSSSLEGFYSQRDTKVRQPQDALSFTMPFYNPYFIDPSATAQTSARVSYRFNDAFGDSLIDHAELWSAGLTASLDFEISDEWLLKSYANFGRSETQVTDPGINQIAAYTAVYGFTPDTALDPFGGATNPALLEAIGDYASVAVADQTMSEFNVTADGPLFATPGGQARLAIGAQTHHEEIEATISNGPLGAPTSVAVGAGDRTINSVFAEFYLPLVGSTNARPGMRSLDVSLAARYDDYSDFGGTTNPKVGVVWGPFEGLNVRGTWGTSFHAPSLADADAQTVDARIQVVPSLPSFLTPPGLGDLDTLIIAGGNPGLKPEEAESYSLGLEFEPVALSGFSASITYYDIEFENGLAIPLDGTGRLYAIPALSQFYILNPTSAQVQAFTDILPLDGVLPSPVELIIDARRQNLEARLQSGLDFNVTQTLNAFNGELVLNINGNYILESDIQAAPNEAVVSDLDSLVRFKARGMAAWLGGPVRASAIVNYLGGSTNATVQPNENIDSFTSVDLSVGYELSELGFANGVVLSFNVDNVFDQNPPYVNGLNSYANGSPLGRKASVALRTTW